MYYELSGGFFVEIDLKLMSDVFARHEQNQGALIAVLQGAQDVYGYLPMAVLEDIAKHLGMTTAKVLGVATFYAQFRTQPVGKNLILLCQGTACHVNDSAMVEEVISDYLGIAEGEITQDGLFSYNNVACLGCCSLAPAMMIGEKVHGNLSREKIEQILDEIKEGAK